MKTIKLKEGQRVFDISGNEYLIEKGDYINYKLTEGFDPLSKIEKKGVSLVSMNYGDHHSAVFYNGILSGFVWFRSKIAAFNFAKEIGKTYNVVYGDWADILPSRNRAAELFLQTYGKEGRDYLKEAIAVYLENNPEVENNEYFIEDYKKSGL